jgi:uncharacterized protein (TIGR03083 family)
MTLTRQVVVPGMLDEYGSFADFLRQMSAEQWEADTRCEGWRVADVAGHVVGQLDDVVNLRLEGLGTSEVTARQVDAFKGRPPSELAEELDASRILAAQIAAGFDDATWAAPGPPGVTSTLGFGLEALWFDTFLHADDMRSAVGIPTVVGPALAPSLSHIAQVLTDQGWQAATLHFDGYGEFPVSGGGPTISGDPMAFVLASTGRSDPGSLGLPATVNIYR